MKRRALLAGALPAGAASVAGCLFGIGGRSGVNPDLELENASPEPAELAILVESNEPAGSQNRETVFEDTVSLSPRERRVLSVLGDGQFAVTATRGEQQISFWTRPICDSARTVVVVDESGELRSDVEDCE